MCPSVHRSRKLQVPKDYHYLSKQPIPMKKLPTHFYQNEAKTYRIYLETLGYHEHTCKAKYLYLQGFFRYLEHQRIFEIEKITLATIIGYLAILKTQLNFKTKEPLSQENCNQRMRIIQSYFGYLQENKRLEIDPSSGLKLEKPTQYNTRVIFSKPQIKALYQATKTRQERAILNLAYGCGLRVGELVQLNQADVNMQENLVLVRKGKNNKRRVVPFTESVKNQLVDYLQSSVCLERDFLFVNQINTRMQMGSFNRILKKLLKQTYFGKAYSSLELQKIGMHTLRHSIATHLLENGMKVAQVQYFLGHKHLETTEIYTHVSEHQLKKVVS